MQPQAVSLSVLGKVLITFSHGIISSWLCWSAGGADADTSVGADACFKVCADTCS